MADFKLFRFLLLVLTGLNIDRVSSRIYNQPINSGIPLRARVPIYIHPQASNNAERTLRRPSSTTQGPLLTADKLRDQKILYSPKATVGTAVTKSGAYGHSSSKEEPENVGFVEPINFDDFLRDIEKTGSVPSTSASRNVENLFESSSEPRDFFGPRLRSSGKNNFFQDIDFPRTASSTQQRSHVPQSNEDEVGFVDPDVQFRSLFDSAPTSNGFSPSEFLNYNSNRDDDGSRSQTQEFPSFTYSGRNEDEDEYNSPKYRSSFRQVPSGYEQQRQDDDSYNSPEIAYDPYEDDDYAERRGRPVDKGYSRGESKKQNSPQRSNSPSSSGNKKPKCKKIRKEVEYTDDFDFHEPEPDYNPASYQSRYKRQNRQRGGGRQGGRKSKTPMTCYVCEDENGRYAERCSFGTEDSDPSKGNSYYHSSSTSYTDNGKNRRRPRSSNILTNFGRKRAPLKQATPEIPDELTRTARSTSVLGITGIYGLKRSASATTRASVEISGPTSNVTTVAPTASIKPKIVEKRQSSDNPQRFDYRERNQGRERERERDYDDEDDFDYGGSPEYEYPGSHEEQPRRPHETHREGSRSRPTSPPVGQSSGFNPERPSGFDFSFDPPSGFHAPLSERSRTTSQPFSFDFSFPRGYDPDVQLGASEQRNTRHQEVENEVQRDPAYDEFVRQFFENDFRSTTTSPPYSSGTPPRFISSGPKSFSDPEREHSESSNAFPSRYFDDPSDRDLDSLVKSFSEKDRSGCQKLLKDGMTCYICRDEKGMNSEECMYSTAGPIPNGNQFHQLTQFSSNPPPFSVPGPHPRVSPSASETIITTAGPPQTFFSREVSPSNNDKQIKESTTLFQINSDPMIKSR